MVLNTLMNIIFLEQLPNVPWFLMDMTDDVDVKLDLIDCLTAHNTQVAFVY